jgi:hypothetical protein
MKTWILAMTMMAGMSMVAQAPADKPFAHNRHERMQKEHLTPQQRAELKSKQLTLKLDLTDKQQKEVEKLFLTTETQKEDAFNQRQEARKAGTKPSADERLATRNRMLNARIAMKRELKKVLNADQYAKLEKLQEERKQNAIKLNGRKQMGKRR